jgi:hypothetical protein
MEDPAPSTPCADPMPRWTRSHPYKKLQQDQIRLIRVLPSSDDAEFSLTCEFQTYALSEKPVFSALSYTWGQPLRDIERIRKSPAKPTRKIFCNGEEGQAGQNLYDFLAHYASNVPQGGLLWIDALSINQGDTQERSEQVKLMSQIYQNAQGVLVWLGPEDRMTDSALELLRGVLLLTADERSMFHPNDATSNHENPLLDLRNWQALSLFFQREWFRRTCTYDRKPFKLLLASIFKRRTPRSVRRYQIRTPFDLHYGTLRRTAYLTCHL